MKKNNEHYDKLNNLILDNKTELYNKIINSKTHQKLNRIDEIMLDKYVHNQFSVQKKEIFETFQKSKEYFHIFNAHKQYQNISD